MNNLADFLQPMLFHTRGCTMTHMYTEAKQPLALFLHTHTFYEILYFLAGEGKFRIEGKEYPFLPGRMYLTRPGESHQAFVNPDIPYRRIVFQFDRSFFASEEEAAYYLRPFECRTLGTENVYVPSKADHDWALAVLEQIQYHCCRDSGQQAEMAFGTFFRSLFLLIRRHYENQEENGLGDAAGDDVIQAVTAYLNDHLMEPEVLSGVAKQFRFSKGYLNSRFALVMGQSMWKYVMVKKLIYAEREIQRGRKACDVAEECGYADYSTFYRNYVSFFGRSPKKQERWRKEEKELLDP